MGAADFLTDDILIEILKRLPEKSLFRFKCVKKSWYDLIQTPYFIALQSDHKKNNPRNIYLLVFLHGGNYVLYGIDPVHHLGYKSDSTHLHDLRPLLVFPIHRRSMNPYLISCFKFGSKLYLFGLDNYFSLHDEKTSVYMIEEKVLMGIEPSEDNTITNFKHLLTKTKNPMHGLKFQPLCFVANSKLYVLSGFNDTETLFEVFSPVDETWHVLPTPYDDDVVPGDFNINQLSHLVVEKEQVVYFANPNDILSFNLQTHKWAPASHHPLTICSPVTIVGEMALGYFHDYGVHHICASKPLARGEEVMRPYLAPGQTFLQLLRSRFTYMTKRQTFYTDYIVGLQDSDNKQVLCIVTYGSKPTENQIACVDYKTSYVALSVFGIPGDLYTENRPVQEHYDTYADEKGEDGDVIRRYFNAKLWYTKHFIISNSHLPTMGIIETCFH